MSKAMGLISSISKNKRKKVDAELCHREEKLTVDQRQLPRNGGWWRRG
jgi:hypothetical protein